MARDPFEMEAGGFVTDYLATTTNVAFVTGQFNFQATFTNKYDTPVAKDDGTLSIDRSGKTKGYAIPTEYLPVFGANGQVSADFDPMSLGLPDGIFGQLVIIANGSENAGEFQGKALQVALAQEDPTVKASVTQALAETRLWAALRA
jgi:hypothetical protein